MLSLATGSLFISVNLQPAVSASPTVTKSPATKTVVTAPAPQPANQPGSPAPTAAMVALPQSCTPDTAYNLPSAVDLTNQAGGLDQVTDPTSYYRIYGNTNTQVENEVKQCAPNVSSPGSQGAEFAAETSYYIDTEYSWTGNGAVCQVSGVKVGLHINMVLPEWSASSSATPELAAQWQSYSSALLTHENGHVALDQQYAAQLLNDLQSFPAADCSSIGSALSAKVNADLAALNAANDAYDTATDHGATQGAILP